MSVVRNMRDGSRGVVVVMVMLARLVCRQVFVVMVGMIMVDVVCVFMIVARVFDVVVVLVLGLAQCGQGQANRQDANCDWGYLHGALVSVCLRTETDKGLGRMKMEEET